MPSIIRGIYAYHTQSRGWSDVGYNFLVDRFGRIWEGRYGGVDRPVVGAHTLGYNEDSFAMSAIGNFETAQPGEAHDQRLRPAVRLEAVPARHRRAATTQQWVHDKLDCRRSTATATPGRPPARAATSTRKIRHHPRSSGRRRRSGRSPSRANGHRPRRQQVARPGGARQGHQHVLSPSAPAARSPSRGRARRSPAGRDGPASRRPATSPVTASPDLLARSASDQGDRRLPRRRRPATSAPRCARSRSSGASTSSPASATSTATATTTWSAASADTKRLLLFPGKGDGAFGKAVQLLGADWSGYDLTPASATSTATARPTWSPAAATALLLVPGTGAGVARHAGRAARHAGAAST